MNTEQGELEFKSSSPSTHELAQVERDLNEIVPILAHGLVRRIEQKGLSGRVRISAMAGNDWGVARSPDNPTDIPNIIIYPRSYLSGDRRLVNARLRHEIGNLNYPIDVEINSLKQWCEENGIAPQLLTSLTEVIHEATVNYSEMQNSHSNQPEENFRALYELDVNTQEIANNISRFAPYKQALDITLLYSLSQVGLVPEDQFLSALEQADPLVREAFDQETIFVLSNLVKVAVPQRKIQLIKEKLWPRFANLAALSPELISKSETASPTPISPLQEQVSQLQEELESMVSQIKPQAENKKQKPEQSKMSFAEKSERDEFKDLLANDLNKQLDELEQQISQLKGEDSKNQLQKPEKPTSLAEVSDKAREMQDQVNEALDNLQSETSPKQDLVEELEEIKEQLELIEEVAKQADNPTPEADQELTEDQDTLADEPMTYNIEEYGIDESQLDQEQLELLNKVREFARNTSKTYRKVMRLLMKGYQRHNPQFTDRIFDEMMIRGYDLPAFSIYGNQTGNQFLAHHSELGIGSLNPDTFLLNFNLPRPIGRFWYRGGNGQRSQPVNEGEIEWGHFYRASMPVIWGAVDQSVFNNLFLDRLNDFGQHDHKNYYYLWEAGAIPPHDNQNENDSASEDQTSEAEKQEGSADGSDESGEGELTSEKMQDLLERLKEALEQAKEQASQSDSQKGQEIGEKAEKILDQVGDLQSALQSGEEAEQMVGSVKEAMQSTGSLGQEMTEEQIGTQSEPMPSQLTDQSHDQFQQGGSGNQREARNLFQQPNSQLLEQLREMESKIGSKFLIQNEEGGNEVKDVTRDIDPTHFSQMDERTQVQNRQLNALEELQRQQQAKMESVYREMSGLSGEALRVYVEYMESMKDFIYDLTDFFIKKFKLDKEYLYERNQRRGARLQRGFTQNIMGTKEGTPVINPRSFERKRPPAKPQFAWSLIIDNSGSCSGEIIEQEKKLAVALIEIAKELDISFEIVTFGGANDYIFLKTFEQELFGEDLQKVVLLAADQGTPDVPTLNAACASMQKFVARFNRSYNFAYFMTDGQSGEGSIQEVIKQYKRDMIVTGIGMAGAAQTIAQTWGKNAVEVPEVKNLTTVFIRKVEEQIDQTFD